MKESNTTGSRGGGATNIIIKVVFFFPLECIATISARKAGVWRQESVSVPSIAANDGYPMLAQRAAVVQTSSIDQSMRVFCFFLNATSIYY